MGIKKPTSGAQYVQDHPHWSEGLTTLRDLLLDTELEEKIKWGIPVFCLDDKNVIGIAGFKHKYGLWFYQGSFMSDPANLLVNAQEGKTKGMRHIYFDKNKSIDKSLMAQYISEAIANQKAAKMIKIERRSLEVGPELSAALKANKPFNKAFGGLRLAVQADYAEYINSAKRADTKERRLQKIIPMVLKGVGLNDKYKK